VRGLGVLEALRWPGRAWSRAEAQGAGIRIVCGWGRRRAMTRLWQGRKIRGKGSPSASFACTFSRSPPPFRHDERFTVPRLFRANNRTTIHFARVDESDFGIGSLGSRQDLVISKELVRRKSLIENDEDL
jgi:hypothetical protein